MAEEKKKVSGGKIVGIVIAVVVVAVGLVFGMLHMKKAPPVKEVPTVAPEIDFIASPTKGVRPLKVQFTDKSTGEIISWNWDFGDGNTSTEQHPSYTYNKVGTFNVTLTLSGAGGTSNRTITNYITVQSPHVKSTPKPAPVVVQPKIEVVIPLPGTKPPRRHPHRP